MCDEGIPEKIIPEMYSLLVKNNISTPPKLTYMKIRMFVIFTLVVTIVIVAGCTQGPGPVTPVSTSQQTTAVTQNTTTRAPQPSFTFGDHYLKESYSFQSLKDVYIEDRRIDNSSWGIGFDILPLTDNVSDSWFVMNVTNRDTGRSDMYGYGRSYGFEFHHLIPMYTTGPYRFEMKGYLVKVDVIVAKRNP
jgi:hypothetical protein